MVRNLDHRGIDIAISNKKEEGKGNEKQYIIWDVAANWLVRMVSMPYFPPAHLARVWCHVADHVLVEHMPLELGITIGK